MTGEQPCPTGSCRRSCLSSSPSPSAALCPAWGSKLVFKYGLVHETVREMEILLADGRIVVCSPSNEHRDLFFGFPNSYGTLGYVLKLRAQVVPVKKYVERSTCGFMTGSPISGVWMNGAGGARSISWTAPYSGRTRCISLRGASWTRRHTPAITLTRTSTIAPYASATRLPHCA